MRRLKLNSEKEARLSNSQLVTNCYSGIANGVNHVWTFVFAIRYLVDVVHIAEKR